MCVQTVIPRINNAIGRSRTRGGGQFLSHPPGYVSMDLLPCPVLDQIDFVMVRLVVTFSLFFSSFFLFNHFKDFAS